MKDSQQKIVNDLRQQIEAINHSTPDNDLAAKLRAELSEAREEIKLTAAHNEAQDKLATQTIKDLYDELRPAFDALGLNYVLDGHYILTTNKATTFLKAYIRRRSGPPEHHSFEGIMFEGTVYEFSGTYTFGWKEFLWRSIEQALKATAMRIALSEQEIN